MGNTPAKGYENSIGSRQKPVVSAGPEAHSPVPLRNDGRVAGDVERAVEEPKRRRVGSSSSTGSRYLQHATDRLSQGRKRNASGAPVFAGQDEHWSRKLERVSEGTWFDMELASHESNEAGTAHSAANDSAADLSRGVRGEDTASASTALAERDLESGAVSLDSCRVRAASTAPDLNDPCEHVRSPLVNSVVDDDGWRSAGSESRQEVDMLRNIKPCKDGKVCVIVASDAHDLTIASASAAAMFCSDAPGSVEQYDEFCQGEMHDTRCETESAETFEPRYSALASPRENLAAEIDADVKITVSSLVNKVCDVLNMGNDESTAARPDDATAEREGNAPVISSGEQAESNKPAAHLLTECAVTGASSASESCGNAGESDRTSGEDVKIYPEDCATPDASDARVHESTPSKENLRQTGDTEMPHRKDSISGDVLIMGERSTSEEVKIALERIVDSVVSVTLATVTNANAADQASVQIAEEDTGDNAEQTKATDPIDTCSRKQLVCDTEQLIINCTGETNVHFTAPTVADSCKESEISDDSYGKQSAVKGEGTDSPQSDKNMEHILPDVVAVLEAVLETIDKMFSEEAATVIPVGADRTSTNTHTELLKHASERDSVEVSPTDVCNDQTVGDRPGSESWSAVYETDAADSCVIELIDQIVSDAVSAAGEGNDCFNKDADALSTITNVKGDTDELNSVEEQVDTSACAPAVVICSASFVAGETEASIAAAAARDTSAGAATDKLEESANTDSSSETYVAEAQCSDVLADATGPERNVLLGQKNSDFEGDFPENVDDERGSGETPLREINSVETAPSLGTEISRDPESVNGFDCATPGAELLSASLTCTTTVTKYDVNPEAGLVMENLLSRVEEVAGHDFTPVQLQGDECVTCPGAFDKTENQNADNSDFAPDPGESDVNQNPASLREETEHRQVVEQVLNKLISDVELHCEYQVRDAAIEQSIAVDERKAQDEPVGDDKTDVNIDSNFASDSESACTSSNTSETDESKGESFDLGDDDASSTKAETPESQSEGSLSFSPYDSLVAVSAESQADADEECAHPAGDGNSRSAREDSEIAEASTEEDQLAVNSCEEKMILKAKKLGEDWERDQRIAQKWNIKPQPDSQVIYVFWKNIIRRVGVLTSLSGPRCLKTCVAFNWHKKQVYVLAEWNFCIFKLSGRSLTQPKSIWPLQTRNTMFVNGLVWSKWCFFLQKLGKQKRVVHTNCRAT